MKKLLLILPFTIFFFSCEQSKEKTIAKKWQAIKLDNPEMAEMIKDQEMFLDTFGQSTDPTANMANYGVQNIDSMRESLKMQLDDFKAMQEHAVKNTWFDFRGDGVAVMNFSGQVDSTNWYFDEEGALILDEMKLKGAGNKIVMQVVELKNDLLKLKFTEDNMTSTVTFQPDKK
jgi:hypothetical protein